MKEGAITKVEIWCIEHLVKYFLPVLKYMEIVSAPAFALIMIFQTFYEFR